MRRKESILVAERNSPVVERIKALKAEHPFWGYRRIWAHLKYIDELEINKKRVLRLLQKYDLVVKSDTRLKAVRKPTKNKPKPDRPNQWWGIDMSKVMVNGSQVVAAGQVRFDPRRFCTGLSGDPVDRLIKGVPAGCGAGPELLWPSGIIKWRAFETASK